MDYDLITNLTLNDKQGDEFRLLCPNCDLKTVHKVLVSAEIEWRYTYPDWYISWDYYQIVQCQGCELPSFRKAHRNTEDQHFEKGNDIPELIEHEELYPSRVAGRQKTLDTYFLPFDVKKIYQETHLAINNQLLILAGIGIRALVETVCKERNAQGNNLSKKIDDLVIQGVLTKDGAEILHSLRLMGNESAHEVKPHTDSDLSIAFEVIEHLLNGVYILPKIASGLPKRKEE